MRILILILSLLATTAHAQSETETYCRKIQDYAKEVTPQLPMQMDVAVTWVGIRALYADGTCFLYHDYVLDSWALIEVVWDHWKDKRDFTKEQLIENYRTEETVEEMRDAARDNFTERMPVMMSTPGVVFQAHYASEGPLDSFTVEIVTGSKP